MQLENLKSKGSKNLKQLACYWSKNESWYVYSNKITNYLHETSFLNIPKCIFGFCINIPVQFYTGFIVQSNIYERLGESPKFSEAQLPPVQ